MTDRDLLELAAKAAGYSFIDYHEPCQDRSAQLSTRWAGAWAEVKKPDAPLGSCRWNPLTDEGDALRLAVKLKINVLTPAGDGDRAMAIIGAGKSYDIATHMADVDGDPYAATRRAVVLAAAEIGRNME